ncbi:MAG: hypothetical protein KC454_08615 [Flavobacteriales bacterium]|nr:hypothetical protein [Flavobacteriales bacterium]
MNTISYHFKAILKTFDLIVKGNYLLFFVPGLIISLFFIWLEYSASSVDGSIGYVSDYSWINSIISYIDTGINKSLSILVYIIDQLYIFIILTVLSPFNTYLGEKLDSRLSGNQFKGGLIRFVNDFIRMVFVVIIALALEFAIMGVYAFFSWVLGFSFLNEYVYWAISAFFFGFSFYDFALERYETSVFGTLGFAFRKPLTMFLTGALFMLIYAIPYIGIPISPVIILMVSTIVYLHHTKQIKVQTELTLTHNE